EPRREGPGPRANAPRPLAHRDHQRFAEAREGGPHRAGRRESAAQGARRAGGLRGAQGAGHPVHPRRDRIHLQSGRRAAPQGFGLPGQDRRRDLRRHQELPREESAARTLAHRDQLKPGTDHLFRRAGQVVCPRFYAAVWASTSAVACARSIAVASSAVMGREKRKPWKASQLFARRNSSCWRVSTPSAITRSFNRFAIAMIASVMSALEMSWGTFMMNERSIFMLEAGRRVSWPSDE